MDFFIGLEDMTGKTELVIFPRLAEKTETFWKEGNLVIVDGKISRRDGERRYPPASSGSTSQN